MNKKLAFSFMFMLFSVALSAQKFEPVFRVSLPDSIQARNLFWADFDNDGLLDVLLTASDTANNNLLVIFRSDTTQRVDTIQALIWKHTFTTGLRNTTVHLTDADLDNDIDIITSGYDTSAVTLLWKNEGDFTFTAERMIDQAAGIIKLGDFDQDGQRELIMSVLDSTSLPQTLIYKMMDGSWHIYDTLLYDTIAIGARSIEILDFDNDGDNDFFLSGTREKDTIVTAVFYNEGDLHFTRVDIEPRITGIASPVDANYDGYFDLLIAGIDSTGQRKTYLFRNNQDGFALDDELQISADTLVPFAADFDANGKIDFSFLGYNTGGDTLNIIVSDLQVIDTLAITGLKAQAFGDADRDGHLDLLQVLKTDSVYELVLSLNKIDSINLAPQPPATAVGVKIFDRLFLYWEKSWDDHTPAEALTYDVALHSPNQDLIMGEYDLIHTKRLTVSAGNTGTNNFSLLKGGAFEGEAFTVQAVDNAFHAGPNDTGSGVCSGGSVSCAQVNLEHLQVCKQEKLSLSAAGTALWFSFSEGFLGESQLFELEVSSPDTIFSFLPGVFDCSAVNVYVIELVKKLKRTTSSVKYVCEGQQLQLGVETGWQSVTWQSALNGFLSNSDSISFTIMKEDTITVNVDDGTGCELQRKTALKISKPEITVNGETFQILKGEQVQLVAEGGQHYHWTPAEGLNNDTIPDPIASPHRTTKYVVTGTDEIGCADNAEILVMVETTAFIPNLFTPNEDGSNDEVKIYGVSGVKIFSFSIHNREGNVVYQTNSIDEMVNAGWDGTVKGNKQPSGVYYWKVSGEYNSGRKVLLNGKHSGSIVLVR